MTLSVACRFALRILFCFACCMAVSIIGKAQVKQPVTNSIKKQIPFSAFTDSLTKHARPAMMPAAIFKGANRTSGITATCNTTTFKMHLTADAGKKIKLQEIQTMTDGNFLLAGNVTLVNTEQEGLLCVMSNAGAVVAQKQVRINNKPTTIFNIKTMFNGQVAMAGIVHETTDKVFVALLNSDLSVSWLKTIDVNGPVSTALDVLPENKIYVAAQVNNGVTYCLLNSTGAIIWNKELPLTGLDNLAGIGHNLFEQTLSANCTNAGKKQVRLFTIEETSGNLLNSTSLGDGTSENKTGKVTSFNARVISTGVTKTNTGKFLLSRHIMYNALETETLHTYTLPEAIDFGVSNAEDDAGDAMGFCFATTGKLLLLRHFAYYQIMPERSAIYPAPVGATMAGVTRSINDGGYLLALNTVGSGECILIKTDSVGVLAGCSSQVAAINYTEQLLVPNTSVSSNVSSTTPVIEVSNMVQNSVVLTRSFDCNQLYCPAPPAEDTCLSSYFKTFRSNSYIDIFNTYHLMRGNKHIMTTWRYNRALGDMNEVTYGVKLFDEKGVFIKGVNAYDNGLSAPIFSKQVDDQHVMVVYYSQVDTIPAFTFTLMDDNLQVVWTKSIKAFTDYYFFGSGTTSVLTSDKDGNYYFYGVMPGYFGKKAQIMTYKMDAAGNPLWLKFYELDAGTLIVATATVTNTALVMVLEGGPEGSVSLALDKKSGQLLKAFNYQNNAAGSIYNRTLQFNGDRIFYTGNNARQEMVIGLFDTTAKPVKMLSLQESLSGTSIEKSGKLYTFYSYFNGTKWKEVLIKADTALAVEYAKEFDEEPFISHSGMGVSDEGNIYVSGNVSYGGANGAYFDAVLKKYDANGQIGTCPFTKVVPLTSEVDLQTKAIGFNEVYSGIFTQINKTLNFIPDTYGQQISEILCSSTPNCTSIKLTGTSKLCQLNQPYTYHATRNANCTIKPVWFYDTAFAVLQMINDTSATIQFKKYGSTWIKLKLNAGCSFFTDSMLVQVQQSPGIFSLGNDTALCKGSSIQLNAGSGFNSYLWQDGSADSVLTVTQPGVYFVSVDNVCGDVYKDTIVVQQVNVPLLNIGRDTSICKGDTLQLAATNGFNQYGWQPAASVNGQGPVVTIYPLQNITITAIATTIEGCKAYDTLALSVKAARPVSLGNDASLCTGDSLVLQAGTGYQQYSWSNGAATETVIVKQAGSYSLIATDVNGCKAKDTMQVQLYALPRPLLGNDFNLCQGSRQQLDAGIFNRYLWQDGSTGRYYNTTTTGTYRVTVTDAHSCTAADTILVKNIIPLPAGFLKATDSICQYEKMTIGAVGSFASYLWSTGEIQPAITINAPGLYTLTVKNADGCAGSDSIYIFQKDCLAGVFIPSAFTPNGDSKNDVFKAIVHGNLVSFRLQIFSRFGVLVFSSTDPQKSWDGKFKGAVLPTSSFIWQCSYQFAGQSARLMKGNVVMFR
jgi:gliding motility-associated-like protein